MAVHTVMQAASSANLSMLRELFVERVNAAADRVVIRDEALPGIPSRLMLASVYLASLGCDALPCRGEETFAWTIETSRQLIAGYGGETDRAALLEEARKAMFHGRRAVCLDMGEARKSMAATVDSLEARWAANSASFFGRRDAEKAVAHV